MAYRRLQPVMSEGRFPFTSSTLPPHIFPLIPKLHFPSLSSALSFPYRAHLRSPSASPLPYRSVSLWSVKSFLKECLKLHHWVRVPAEPGHRHFVYKTTKTLDFTISLWRFCHFIQAIQMSRFTNLLIINAILFSSASDRSCIHSSTTM